MFETSGIPCHYKISLLGNLLRSDDGKNSSDTQTCSLCCHTLLCFAQQRQGIVGVKLPLSLFDGRDRVTPPVTALSKIILGFSEELK